MQSQNKYKKEIVKELEDIPEEDMPNLLEIIRYLKTGMMVGKKNQYQ